MTSSSPRSGGNGTPRTPSSVANSPAMSVGDAGGPSSPMSGLSQSSGVPRTPSSIGGRSNSSRRTPQRQRGDIARGPAYPPVSPAAEAKSPSSRSVRLSSMQEVSREVWGTTVDVKVSDASFEKFLREFKDTATDQPLYINMLDEVVQSQVDNLNLNCDNLFSFDDRLYHELVSYPQELIPLFDLVVNRLVSEMYPSRDAEGAPRIQVRPFKLKESSNMRDLNPENIDTLISLKGMVIRAGGILPDMKTAFFQCTMCENTEEVMIDQGEITEPVLCSNCNQRYSMELIHNRGTYADKQLIKIQETPDAIPEGQTPHTVTIFAYEALVDVAKPGDRVEITGVYKAVPVKQSSRKRALYSVYKTYVDAIHVAKTDKKRFSAEDAHAERESEFFTSFEEGDELTQVSDQRRAQIIALGQEPDIYEKLTRSIAPSVWEMDDVKRGLLCQLFGGANNNIGASQGRFRGEINVLLCGDPGTSKSQLLQYVHQIAPRGIYTSGKGTSSVGLTAYISKDPETQEMVLESGALVLSDRGICCIDEFDKMSFTTRSILHEVMEQQTVSIAKAGIVCTLNARTSILASANPLESRYNPKLSVVQNIQLGPTLLSRFDLIYLILDQPDEQRDRRLGKHITSLYFQDVEQKAANRSVLNQEMLTAYISYARRSVHPVLTDEATDALINAYVEMRRMGQAGARKIVTATPRQLESLIRLSEALARMKLSERVTTVEVEEAKRLMSVATQAAATDPVTGRIDMDMLTTGQSTSERTRVEMQLEALRLLITNQKTQKTRVPVLLDLFAAQTSGGMEVGLPEFKKLLNSLEEEGFIKMSSKNEVLRL
eukprot:gb/GEZN01001664.1/.p1 GENE.gb/GEZN01001664.1/~~gb/GEZN01001664.1/.p1  ORF type:complete len:830 (-),score=115.11 gb/GEZN01001664.1/:311-2800(-)